MKHWKDWKVIDTRKNEDFVRRRRRNNETGERITTIEVPFDVETKKLIREKTIRSVINDLERMLDES